MGREWKKVKKMSAPIDGCAVALPKTLAALERGMEQGLHVGAQAYVSRDEMLLGKGQRDGARVLSPQAVEAVVAAHRVGRYDHTFRHVMDWGLGLILNSARYGPDTVPYGYGPYASPRTFGHGGSQCCTGF